MLSDPDALTLHDEHGSQIPQPRSPRVMRKRSRTSAPPDTGMAALVLRVEASSRKPGADPLQIAKDEIERLRSGDDAGTVVDLARLLVGTEGLMDALTHLGQSALLLVLSSARRAFFEGEWKELARLLGGGRNEFRERALLPDVGPGPLPVPDAWLEVGAEPEAGQRASQEELAGCLAEAEAGGEEERARLRALLSDLAEEQEPVAAPLTAALGDDGLSLLLRDFLGDDASLACASAFFRHVLRPRVLGLSGAPSMSLVESIAAAAACRPGTLAREVLSPATCSPELGPPQVELLKRACRVDALRAFASEMMRSLAVSGGRWSEAHLAAMLALVQACGDLGEGDLGEVCASLRRRAQDFSSSLHFAKLVGEIVRKFPREARPQRLVLLEALDCNTTFFAKIAASKAQRL